MTNEAADSEFLILAKTYPYPSKKYRETTCVAAVTREGHLRRLYPIAFRFLSGDRQFKKWEWVSARVSLRPRDRRPESRRVDADSIRVSGEWIDTSDGWDRRLVWTDPHMVGSFAELEGRRLATRETLGILRPSRLVGLDVTPQKESERDWTEDELLSLTQEGLFDPVDQPRPALRKIPFNFHYRYEIDTPNGTEQKRHMITDWEAGQLYWNCVRSHGQDWQRPFRQRLETEFARKDLQFVMGTMYRHPRNWLIVGLIYPPKRPARQIAMEL